MDSVLFATSEAIFCFIDNWVKEIQSYNRNNKLKSVIDNTDYADFDWDDINNNYICGGTTVSFYAVKKENADKLRKQLADFSKQTAKDVTIKIAY